MPKKLKFASMCQIFLIVVVSAFTMKLAEAVELRFSHLDAASGLQQGSIDALTQDRFGFLWVGTADGLVRYDGGNVVTYRNDPDDIASIPDNVITALLYSSDGNLWVGSEADGVSYYDYQTDKFVRLDSHKLGRNIQALYPYTGNQGTLVKTELGIHLINVNGVVHRMLSSALSKEAVAVFTDDSNSFVLTQSGQYFKLTDDPGNPLLQFSVSLSPILAHTTNSCQLLIYDAKEKFQCVNDGVSVPHRLNTAFVQSGIDFSDLRLIDLIKDDAGVIWISTKAGLLRVEGDKVTLSESISVDPYSLSSNKLSRLLLGQQGELFVGTQTKGLNITRTRTNGIKYLRTSNNAYHVNSDAQFKTYNEAACSYDESDYNTVWAILKDSDNDLWVGNFSGLAYQPSGSDKFQDHSRLGIADGKFADLCSVWSLAEAKGLIWMGTWEGLYAFSKKDNTSDHYSMQNEEEDVPATRLLSDHAVRVLLYDKYRDSLWVGTNHGGLNRINFRTGAVHHYPFAKGEATIPHKRIRSLYLDEQNRLWVGSGGGLSLWNEQEDSFKTLKAAPHKGYLSDEDVRSIYQTDDQHLLLGTGNGLNIFNIATFSVEKRLSEKHGLANSTVYATVSDGQGKLLISTANGLSYYNHETEKFDNYSIEDGLQSNEFNFNAWHKDKEGLVYFGGISGLNIIDPDKLQTRKAGYAPVVLSLDAYGSDGKIQSLSKMFSHGVVDNVSSTLRNIHFSYVFPSFLNKESVETYYKVGSENTAWSPVHKNFHSVDYQNLQAGIHKIELIARGQPGNPFKFSLTISHQFWEMWWFKGFLLLLGILLTILITRQVYKSKGRAYVNKMTRQHYQVVEHELRPHLYELNKKLGYLLESGKLSVEDRDSIKSNVMPLLSKSVSFISELRCLIDFKQAAKQKKHLYMLEDIVAEVLCFFSDDADQIAIYNVQDVNVETHQDAVYLVIKNLVSNAIKYSPKGSKVHLKFSYKDRQNLVIECLDQGVGISKNRRRKIYQPYESNNDGLAEISSLGLGLTIVKFIVQTYKGNIEIKDNEPHGSHFIVILKGVVRYEQ